MRTKSTYIISDLHLGGDFRDDWARRGPGSRLCSAPEAVARLVRNVIAEDPNVEHVIINGDSVDFLAANLRPFASDLEELCDDASTDPTWLPFIQDEAVAVRVLSALLQPEDAAALRSLGHLIDERGVSLTLMLGNHDLELAYPACQGVLASMISALHPERVHFDVTGSPMKLDRAGTCVVVRGNAADDWNRVDYDALRRHVERGPSHHFDPPPGSKLVASVMNAVKKDWPFVDLLKPELTLAVPILALLDPSQALRMAAVTRLYLEAKGYVPRVSDVAHTPTTLPTKYYDANPLDFIMEDLIGPLDTAEEARTTGRAEDIASAATWLGILTSRLNQTEERRARLLRRIIREAPKRTFAHGSEDDPAVRTWVSKLAEQTGAKCIVAGHTHLPRDADIDGVRYINSGTFADVLRLPYHAELLSDAWTLEILRGLGAKNFEQGKVLDGLLLDTPRYVVVRRDEAGGVVDTELLQLAP